jgi:hypothetical protein
VRYWIPPAPAQVDRVSLRRGGDLVDEALDHEAVVGDPHSAPPGRTKHRLLVLHIFDADGGDVVQQLLRSVHGVAIEAVLEGVRQEVGEDGRSNDSMAPGDGPPSRIEPGDDPVDVIRTVDVVLDILLPSPYHLDWTLDLPGDPDGLGHIVMLEPPAEAATEEEVVNYHLLER